jgi:hypothetical protein
MSKRWTEELPVVLTREELLSRGESLAHQDAAWAKLDAERKRAVDDFKAGLLKIESETARLALIVREKAEPRQVWVVEQRDFTENRVDFVREDTGEVVRTRVMTESERQMELLPRIEKADPIQRADDEAKEA